MKSNKSAFLGGAGIVWRHQRILWGIYLVNLFLALASAQGLVARLSPILNRSLAASRLVRGFDLAALAELSLRPQAPLSHHWGILLYSGFVFLVFTLFATGGILATYWQDAKLSGPEFFGACGRFSWRLARFALILLIQVSAVFVFAGLLKGAGEAINSFVTYPQVSVIFEIGIGAAILFVLLVLRLWFDMAEVMVVAENERQVLRALRSSARLVRNHFREFLWYFLRISLISWVVSAAGFYIWMFVLRPESIHKAIILGQLMAFFSLGMRLWQRASGTLWYRQHGREVVEARTPTP